MLIQSNSKLLMIGDSITDCGRVRPIGENFSGALGGGYVNLVNGLLQSTCPETRIRVVNTGLGGNRICDLEERWQTDVIDLNPDWLSIMIGINDVWRHFDNPLLPENHLPIEEFEETYDRLLEKTRPSLKGLVLMTPFYIETNKQDPMRIQMDKYGAVVKKLAEKHDGLFVDIQAAFDKILDVHHSYALAGDRIHPNVVGHMVIAKAFLNAVDFEW